MKQNGFSKFTRRMSSRLLNMMVKPHVIGEVPVAAESAAAAASHNLNETSAQLHHLFTPQPSSALPLTEPQADTALQVNSQNSIVTIYVLQTYSRSNALLLDNETKRLRLPRALEPIQTDAIDENKALFFLHYPQQKLPATDDVQQFPPRLQRLIEAVEQHPECDIHLVPVTVLWGREPDKEDSWLKLLFTDSWTTPSRFKQFMNIGIHGRETYIEFHEPQSLRALIEVARRDYPNLSEQTMVVNTLNHYLDSKRAAILGPDLSDRRNVVQGVLRSEDIQAAIRQESIRDKVTVAVAEQRAFKYLNEIVSDYSYSAVKFAERSLTYLWTQLYDGVEVHNFSTVRELSDKYEMIYTPCHRSHIDYLLLSYVIFRRGLVVPHVAAGDNLNLPFVGQLLRGGGAFFIRRSFKDAPLYSAVFKEYLHSLLVRNTPIEYFIEGGRSRSGRLLPPKTGMLAMTIHSYLRNHDKPIVFIPTYIGYERLMEGSTYVGEMQGKPKEAESIFGIIKALRKIERIFGKVHLNFGEPIFLDDILQQQNAHHTIIHNNQSPIPPVIADTVNLTAQRIMQNINRAAVVNPVSLLSLVLLATPKHTLDEQSCIAQLDTYRHISASLPYDERIMVTPLSGQEIIAYGLKLKLIKRIKHILGDMIAIEDQQAVLLTYFRNNILHLFTLPSLIAALVDHNGKVGRDDLHSVIKALYPFLQAELFLKWQPQAVEPIIDRYIEALIASKWVLDDGRDNLYSPVANSEAQKQLQMLAAPVKQSLERYFMILALISRRGSGTLSSKQAEELGYLLGQRLSVLYEFNSPESFDKALFHSFIHALAEQNLIEIDDEHIINFDERLHDMAQNAPLILDEDTLLMLEHITAYSHDELQQALDELARQKSSKIRKKK